MQRPGQRWVVCSHVRIVVVHHWVERRQGLIIVEQPSPSPDWGIGTPRYIASWWDGRDISRTGTYSNLYRPPSGASAHIVDEKPLVLFRLRHICNGLRDAVAIHVAPTPTIMQAPHNAHQPLPRPGAPAPQESWYISFMCPTRKFKRLAVFGTRRF